VLIVVVGGAGLPITRGRLALVVLSRDGAVVWPAPAAVAVLS